jgi:hypothetical protein
LRIGTSVSTRRLRLRLIASALAMYSLALPLGSA